MTMTNTTYTDNKNITPKQFIDLLDRSTLGERRPVHDTDCMAAMLKHADILITAWRGDLLVGVARSVSDFAYCCFLSDLAVDAEFQHQGIGRKLIQHTVKKFGKAFEKNGKLILLSAPNANDYYPKLGFVKHNRAWVLSMDKTT